MNHSYNPVLLLVLMMYFVILSGCSDDTDAASEGDVIAAYLSANGIAAQKTDFGFYYIIDTPVNANFADTLKPLSNYLVITHLKGALLDNTVFGDTKQKGDGQPIVFDLSHNRIIEGLRRGIALFGRGQSGRLFLPSRLAYGSGGDPVLGIPPNTPVMYYVELQDFYPNESAYNDSLITQYIREQRIAIDTTLSSGIYITIVDPGDTRNMPGNQDTIVMQYQGYFFSGELFVDSRSVGIADTIDLGQSISGWSRGIPVFGVGGRGRMIVPSQMAYGFDGTDTIPPYTPLIYDIRLLSIQ